MPPSSATLLAIVRGSAAAILRQQSDLLQRLDQSKYVWKCPVAAGSVSGHIRHSLDHFVKILDSVEVGNRKEESDKERTNQQGAAPPIIYYDRRSRQTSVETDLKEAQSALQDAARRLSSLDASTLKSPVSVSFMLSDKGNETTFDTNVAREIQFAMHHAIHHNAMIRLILHSGKLIDNIPREFGLAPSTANYSQINTSGNESSPPAAI